MQDMRHINTSKNIGSINKRVACGSMQPFDISSYSWCRLPVSNWPPDDYKSTALPNELSRRNLYAANYTLFNSRQSGAAALFWRVAVVVGAVRRLGSRLAGAGRHGRQSRCRRAGRRLVGRRGRAAGLRFERHALAVFVGVDGHDVADRHVDFARDAAEAGVETDAVVVHLQAGGGAEADVEDDFALLHIFHRHRGRGVDLDGEVGRVAAVGAPFVDGAQHVGLGRDVGHDLADCKTRRARWQQAHRYFSEAVASD